MTGNPKHKHSQSRRKVDPSDARDEMKAYGLHACIAIARHRPEDIVRMLLLKERQAVFREALRWCAANRRAYRFVEADELARVSGSQHHEGVCMVVRVRRQPALEELLSTTGAGSLLYLDQVGNPHNLGAIVRVAAHFGARGILVAGADAADLSGAALRVAEGGAEYVPVIVLDRPLVALRSAEKQGWELVATAASAEEDLFASKLQERVIVLLGAEGEGLRPEISRLARRTVAIPGTGAVESLNVACAATAVLTELWRRSQSRS